MSDAAPPGAWCYVLNPSRPELVTNPSAEERDAVAAHFAHLESLLRAGALVLAGRSLSEQSPFGIVVLELSEDDARRAMNDDPAVARGVMTAELVPFRIALLGSA